MQGKNRIVVGLLLGACLVFVGAAGQTGGGSGGEKQKIAQDKANLKSAIEVLRVDRARERTDRRTMVMDRRALEVATKNGQNRKIRIYAAKVIQDDKNVKKDHEDLRIAQEAVRKARAQLRYDEKG